MPENLNIIVSIISIIVTVTSSIFSVCQARRAKRYKSDIKKLYEGEEMTRFIEQAHIVLTKFYVNVRQSSWGRAKNVDKEVEEVTKLLMEMNKYIHQIDVKRRTEINKYIEKVNSYINVISTLSEIDRKKQSDSLCRLDSCLQQIRQEYKNNLLR